MADVDLDKLLGQYNGPVRPTIKPYDPPWYDQVTNWATDALFGDNATARQRSGMDTAIGLGNPFNFPAGFTHGVNETATGVRRGDPSQVGHGAVETVLNALPGVSVVGRAARAMRPVPQPIPEGPWTMGPQEFGAWRDRHPTQFEVQPPAPAERPLPPSEDAARNKYGLHGERAIEHLLGFYGPEVPPGGRPWTAHHDLMKVRDSELSHSDMTKLLTQSIRNNEHLPKVADEARGIMHDLDAASYDVRRMDGIAQELAANQRKIEQKWQRATSPYEEEFQRFHPNGFLMEPHELREILQQHYGVGNNASHDIIAKAYSKFAADERAASKTGQPTWHDRYQKKAEAEADALLEESTGIKITDEASREKAHAAWDKSLSDRIDSLGVKISDLERARNVRNATPPFLGLAGGMVGAKYATGDVDTSDIMRRLMDAYYGDHNYRP